MKIPALTLLLALSLALPVASAQDDADRATRQRIENLQRQAEKQLAGATGEAVYRPAKVLAWLDFAMHELLEQDRIGIVEQSVAEAERLLAATTTEAAFETPSPTGTERVREDLWAKTTELKKSKNFGCAAREIAQLEVQLIWAGHEKWESGWAHARPAMEVAENLAYEAEMAQRACAPQARDVEKISISGDALFPLNKDDVKHITAEGRERLAAFANDLKTWKSIERIVVVGHTDRLGSPAYNDGLSRRRAENIRAYLIHNDLPAERIVAAGHGGRSPLVQCADGTGRRALVDCLQANRRVEIMVSGER
jgi:outer membrane protein OmpA-like peptidoglycan-associated protein